MTASLNSSDQTSFIWELGAAVATDAVKAKKARRQNRLMGMGQLFEPKSQGWQAGYELAASSNLENLVDFLTTQGPAVTKRHFPQDQPADLEATKYLHVKTEDLE